MVVEQSLWLRQINLNNKYLLPLLIDICRRYLKSKYLENFLSIKQKPLHKLQINWGQQHLKDLQKNKS